jgi:CubicO group peptidase (beta-lactamase class C family)
MSLTPFMSSRLTTAVSGVAGTVMLALLLVGCSPTDDPDVGVDHTAIDTLFAEFDQPGSPGCALAVARRGEIVYSRGYGYANLDYDIPISAQTVFDVASVNKQFVAAILTMLALEGSLSLDDDVREWLPELPEYERPITLQQMIHHTSGLRDYLNLFPLAGRDDYFPISHDQILAMMSRQRALAFLPGDQYSYSNTAYMLLAQVVERATGKSLGEVAQERIFEPLGMEGSRMYDDREEIIPGRAIGYDRDDTGHLRVVHNYNFDVAGDGQLYSTMEDLLRWDDYLHGAAESPIYSMMMVEGRLDNGEPTGYAQGLRLDEYRGLRTVRHSGGSWGFRTQLIRFVEPGLSVAISCNADFAEPWLLAQRVADHYLADRLEPESEDEADDEDRQEAEASPEPPSLTPDELVEFVGIFHSPELDATYRLSLADGGLVVRIEQEQPLEVVPVTEDGFEFMFHPDGWSGPSTVRLEFRRAPSGAVIGFELSSGSERGLVFEKRLVSQLDIEGDRPAAGP